MTAADQVVKSICESYAKIINACDVVAYSELFTADVIWMQPNAPVRQGRDEVIAAISRIFESNKLDIEMTPGDTIQISAEWIFGLSHVDGIHTVKADGSKSPFKFTVAQLIQRQMTGEWLIRRQMWNNKPV